MIGSVLIFFALALMLILVGYIFTYYQRPEQRQRAKVTPQNTSLPRSPRPAAWQMDTGRTRQDSRHEEHASFNDVLHRMIVGIGSALFVFQRRASKTPHMRLLLALLALFCVAFYFMILVFPNAALSGLMFWQTASASSSTTSTAAQPSYHVSQLLQRLSQLDPSQYASNQEYQTWAYSACSTTSMTEVLNAYGHHYRVTDILKVEAGLGEITPQQGLMEEVGIARTVARFGFKTTWGHNFSLDRIIHIANAGRPVIVSFPPGKYADGHLLVVTGGDSQYVYLADSSLVNRHILTHAQFLNWWGGFYAIVTPNA